MCLACLCFDWGPSGEARRGRFPLSHRVSTGVLHSGAFWIVDFQIRDARPSQGFLLGPGHCAEVAEALVLFPSFPGAIVKLLPDDTTGQCWRGAQSVPSGSRPPSIFTTT